MLFVSLVLITLTSIVISYFILNYHHYRSSIKVTNSLLGLKTLSLIGNIYSFLWRSEAFLDVAIKLTKQDYSSPVKFLAGSKLWILIYEPDQMQVILQNSQEKNSIYKLFEPIFGKFGLITVPASIWTKNRKIMAPCFTTVALQKFFNVFVEQSLITTDELEKIVLNKNKIILFNHIAKYAFSTVCGTMMNIKKEFLTNQINQFLEMMKRERKILLLRMRNIFLHINFIFNLTAIRREHQKLADFFKSFIDKVIQEHINSQNINNKHGTIYKKFLDVLIETSNRNKDKFPQKMIHDNLLTIILTGTDTTTISIDFAILMKFPRDTREIILPKGTEIILPIITLHRDKKYWPNPLVFDPDRFLPEKIKTSYKYYMPFSYGSRNCIGMKYAMTSIKVILATLIRTFVFKVEKSIEIDKIKLNSDMALSIVEPIEIIIEKRELH